MICQNKNSKIVLKTKGYELHRCLACGIIFSHKDGKQNLNEAEIYTNYYKKEKATRFGGPIEMIVKMFRFMRAYRVHLLRPKGKSMLDIGSGRGWILYFMRKYFGYERTIGTQLSMNAYEFSKEKLKLEIYNKDLLDISFDTKFDVISILHVLEHVENVELYVEKIYELLNEKGLLFIEVPNYNAWSRKFTNEHWLALDLKHHLAFFTTQTLISLLEKYNFKIKKVRTFSLEYSTFTSTQSILNYITNTDSYFFEWLQNKGSSQQAGGVLNLFMSSLGRSTKDYFSTSLLASQNRTFNLKIFLHTFLFAILFFPCLLINLCLYFSNNGEVVTIYAEKND